MSNIQQQEKIKYYGYYTLHNGGYRVVFFNKITNSSELIGRAETEDEAKLLLGKRQFEFYSEYPRLLPKFINLCRDTGISLFIFSVTNPVDNNSQIHIGSFITIQDAIKAKKNLVSRLVE